MANEGSTKPTYSELDRRRIIPAELRRYSWQEVTAMQKGPNGRFVCEECDACEIVSSGPHHFVCHICWLMSELDKAESELARVRGLLQRLLAESFSGEKVLRCRLCGSKLEHGHFGNCIVHELEAENVR